VPRILNEKARTALKAQGARFESIPESREIVGLSDIISALRERSIPGMEQIVQQLSAIAEAHRELGAKRHEELVRAIEGLSKLGETQDINPAIQALTEAVTRKPVPYRHTINRNQRDGLAESIDSMPVSE